MEAKLLAVLLSWTVNLSSYPHPGVAPEIIYKPRQFFVDTACQGNQKCKAAAWYNDKNIIYLDDRLIGHTDANTRSVVVHELVHYLQDLSGEYEVMDCGLYAKREREAYSVQRQYLNKIAGQFVAIYMNYPPCQVHAN
jgi:ribose 5-phosphate isomerase RpiB